jgi:hypothetical protein
MKYIYFFLAALFITVQAFAQNDGDYQSNGAVTVTLHSAANWLFRDGGAWVAATNAPSTATSGAVITILSAATLDNTANCTIAAGVTVINQSTTGNTITNIITMNGTYVHNTATASSFANIRGINGGNMVLGTGSTCIFRGSSSLSTNVHLSSFSFFNLIFESTSGTYSTNSITGVNTSIVNGDFTIGANVTLNSSSSGQRHFYGNFIQNGSVSGTFNCYFFGSGKTISGNGTIQYNVFNINSAASITLESNIQIKTGSTGTIDGVLSCGTNTISGAGTGAFTLSGTGTLKTGHSNGVNGTVTVPGTKTFSSGHKIEWNGTVAQSTGLSGLTLTTPTTYTMSNTGGTVTADANVTFGTSSSLIVNENATFDASTFTFTFGTTSTATLNGYLITGNANGFNGAANTTIVSTNSPAITLGTNNTIEYNSASAQSLTPFGNYRDLIISGAGTKTATAQIQTHTHGDITISGTLDNGGFDIRCGGNVSGSGTMTGAGDLEMLVHGKSVSVPTLSNLKINTGGIISLSAELNITEDLNFALGALSLGANNLILNSAATITGNSNSKYIITNSTGVLTRNSVGASNTIFPVGTTSSYNPVTLNNAGTSDNFSVRVKTAFANAPNIPAQVVNRAWDITESVGGGSDVTITLQWNVNEEANLFDRNTGLHISRYTGSEWVTTSASLVGADPYTATASNFTTFSEFGVGSDGALPVELTSFTASSSENAVNLNWVTATEVNNFGFEIERKIVGTSRDLSEIWATISFIKGNGNSNSPKEYSFIDESVKDGKYSYRLKQIDFDGNFEYSEEIEVDIKTTPVEFNLAQNYPNPFNPETMIEFTLPENGQATLKVYNSIGEEVATLFNEFGKVGKYYQVRFDASTLASGIYLARLQFSDKQMMKKMVFLK